MTDPIPHVEFHGVTKRYGATVAVAHADLTVLRGHVHALVGENGAGKSTLGKIVAGIVTPDEGQVSVSGQAVHFGSPRDALHHGITTIAQELSLVPSRSIIENVYLGIEDSVGGVVRTGALAARYRELVRQTGIDMPADAKVRSLTVAGQQKVEILRAVARRSELIIMDEPTARLSSSDAAGLRRLIRSLAAGGTTVVLISHFLEEVLEVADTVTVMRDGRIVRTAPTAAETKDSLIEAMIGRSLAAAFPAKQLVPDDAPVRLRVRGLTREPYFRDISFDVRAGEIVVLAGLIGAGRSEMARGLFGAELHTSGHVELDGKQIHASAPRDAMRHGIAMIPESRKEQGLILDRAVAENVSLPHLKRFSRAGVISPSRERAGVTESIRNVGVRLASISQRARSLSGGNQQKVLFARWLLTKPRLLIADEPTRGIDVGSKRNIYDLLVDLAASGAGVLVISSELEEVLGLAHRIVIMREGHVAGELDGRTATEADVMALAFRARKEA
jgi:simple sugar transport system ATP-binding protein/ribose transport system ATP-binding protein